MPGQAGDDGSALEVLDVHGVVHMRESDTLIDQTTLEAKIRRGIEEYEQGKVHRMEEGESVDGFLSRMIDED